MVDRTRTVYAQELMARYGWSLKPCPFCGDPRVEPRVHPMSVSANCLNHNCGASVEFEIDWRDSRHRGLEGVLNIVVTRWNRRGP